MAPPACCAYHVNTQAPAASRKRGTFSKRRRIAKCKLQNANCQFAFCNLHFAISHFALTAAPHGADRRSPSSSKGDLRSAPWPGQETGPQQRPIKIVDGGQAVKELFS